MIISPLDTVISMLYNIYKTMFIWMTVNYGLNNFYNIDPRDFLKLEIKALLFQLSLSISNFVLSFRHSHCDSKWRFLCKKSLAYVNSTKIMQCALELLSKHNLLEQCLCRNAQHSIFYFDNAALKTTFTHTHTLIQTQTHTLIQTQTHTLTCTQ